MIGYVVLICAEYKSFSKVAEHLHMTQPAVSKQIRKLEDELGVELLHRSPQGIQLTEAGIQFQKNYFTLEDWEIIKRYEQVWRKSGYNIGVTS